MNLPPPYMSMGMTMEIEGLRTLAKTGSSHDVTRVLESWRSMPAMLTPQGHLDPRHVGPAILEAIRCVNAGALLAMLANIPHRGLFPIKAAVDVSSPRNFEVFMRCGWDINQPLGPAKPPALGYVVHNPDLVDWFLARGASPNAGPNRFLTALSMAVFHGPALVIAKMLDKGADVTLGQLLHWAIRRKASDAAQVARMLLERGAPLNEIEWGGQIPPWIQQVEPLGSPLHNAVKVRKVDIVSLLLEYDADIDLRDTAGKLPMDIAQRVERPSYRPQSSRPLNP